MTTPQWLPAGHAVVTATGSEAATYLHGQLSADVEGLEVGASAWSFLLEPRGQMIGLVHLRRTDETTFELGMASDAREEVVTSLDRFKLRTDVTFATVVEGEVTQGAERVAEIGAGVPSGADLRGAIPAETGFVSVAVDFTKGCYRGQELVERIASRGSHRRRLAVLDPEGPVDPGATVTNADGDEVGTVTSVAVTDDRYAAVALLRREVDVGSTVRAATVACGVGDLIGPDPA